MGKQFRVIEGGRSSRKDGLKEVPGQPIMAELRHVTARRSGLSFGARAVPVAKPGRKMRRWGKRGGGGFGGIRDIVPLALVLFVATFLGVWTLTPAPLPAGADPADTERASFGFCHEGGGYNCVVDGDTLYYKGTKIRIADIDTPETHPPRCAAEAELGAAATQRLQALVNAGPFTLASIDRDEDPYGRKLRVVTRGGESLGGVLVDEGLARWYEGGRRAWC